MQSEKEPKTFKEEADSFSLTLNFNEGKLTLTHKDFIDEVIY